MIQTGKPVRRQGSHLLLVDSSVLPDVFLKVVRAKRLLATGEVRSFSEAARLAGISRSALYKYKDRVFLHTEDPQNRVITISANLEDRPGVLSSFLNLLSENNANILTVNQNIPVDGVAPVSVSVRLPVTLEIDELRAMLHPLHGLVDFHILSAH